MIFNSIAFFLAFLIPAAILFRRVAPRHRATVAWVSGAAFFIYFSLTSIGGVPGAACLGLIVYQSIFCVTLCPRGKAWCTVAILQAVAILAIFKYMNFVGALVFGGPQNNPIHWAGAFLPLGISFFTFEFVHYAADVRSGKIPPARLGDFLAFILFFPSMVAGPIKRFPDFQPHLEHESGSASTDFHRGLTRILFGLARKFAVADFLTALTDHLNPKDIADAPGRGVLLLWILAYAFKIYFDFSSYSDIAIGSARLFGIRLPENFNAPYLKTNIAAFWQSWHMTLYRWLVDYVFIPLGGSRVSPPRIYGNIMTVMLVSGIWHGAGLNFVAWGAWHGILLWIHRAWSTTRYAALPVFASAPMRLAGGALTFCAVTFGWIFFAMDMETSVLFIRRLLRG
ncbi:MAG: MBOAT family O-acyltransferase [Armatimonadaceae bacterium]